jgi:hypothetical protein
MATESTENTDIQVAGPVVRLDKRVLTPGQVRRETRGQSGICVAEPVQGSAASAGKFLCFPCLPWLFSNP